MTLRTSESTEHPATIPKAHRGARVTYGVIAICGVIVLVMIARYLLAALGSSDLAAIIERHGPAVLGIPAAAAVAFVLVGLVRALDGPLALDALGLKVEGAGAAAVIWIAVFLAISLSFRALW
jgi:hypothetical protein